MLSLNQATDHLGRMVARDIAPVLDDTAVNALIALVTGTDAAGNPTYALARAAAEGWRQKAGLASGCHDVATGDQKLSRHQIFAHCMDMAERYARMDAGSLLVLTDATDPANQPDEPIILL